MSHFITGGKSRVRAKRDCARVHAGAAPGVCVASGHPSAPSPGWNGPTYLALRSRHGSVAVECSGKSLGSSASALARSRSRARATANCRRPHIPWTSKSAAGGDTELPPAAVAGRAGNGRKGSAQKAG